MGCQFNPYANLSGLDQQSIQSEGFTLLALQNQLRPAQNQLRPAKVLHIYIEGDGQPWASGKIATNPGPFKLPTLSLLQQDSSPSLYLGRPCYFQDLVGNKNCHPSLWTRARYSQQIVDLMVSALLSRKDLDAYEEWVLVGHSGGGTLAYLMAQQLPKVKKVVAIASNLDVDAWVTYHQYAPLDLSLNPARLHSKPLQLFYLAGGKDKNVPLKLNQHFLNKVNAEIIFRDEYDHNCCWQKDWSAILEKF